MMLLAPTTTTKRNLGKSCIRWWPLGMRRKEAATLVRQACRRPLPQSAFCFWVWFRGWISFFLLFCIYFWKEPEEGVSEGLDMKQTFLVPVTADADRPFPYLSVSAQPDVSAAPPPRHRLSSPWRPQAFRQEGLGLSAVSIVMGQWQGFPNNWKDRCPGSFPTSAP